MTNEKIIRINNRIAEKTKPAVGTHAAERGAAQLETVIWTAVRSGTCSGGAAVIRVLHDDIYYAKSVPTMPAGVCVVWAGEVTDSLAQRRSRAARSVTQRRRPICHTDEAVQPDRWTTALGSRTTAPVSRLRVGKRATVTVHVLQVLWTPRGC